MAGFILLAQPPGGVSLIPLSFDDPIFAGAETVGAQQVLAGGTLFNKSITADGAEASVKFQGAGTMTQCRVNSREAVRFFTGNITVERCYLESEGITPDHADTIQCFGSGSGFTYTVKNTCIVAHNHDQTAGYFSADFFAGTHVFQNVVFQGGPYGLRIHADGGGDAHVSLDGVYFITGSFATDPFLFVDFAGDVVIIDQWNNVRDATIVDGVLIPGALIPEP